MLNDIFKAVVITSCMGAALTAVLVTAKPLTKRFFSARWNYYIWFAVIAVMLIPLKFDIPAETVADMPDRVRILVNVGQSVIIPVENAEIFRIGIAEVWFAVVLLLFCVKLLSYGLFLCKIRKSGEKIFCDELGDFTTRKITVVKSDKTISPLMTGLFKPVLILPETEMTEKQKHYVLIHELTHFKRKDIFYKWLVCLVKCLHWFNPAIYFASGQIDVECEISCDIAATEHMTKEEKMAYVDTILALVSAGAKKMPLTTAMASGKGILKRRIRSIAKMQKNSRFIKIFSTSVAVVFLIGIMFVSGTAAGLMMNEIEQRLVLSGKMPVIEFEVKPTQDKPIENVQPDYRRQTEEMLLTGESISGLTEESTLPEDDIVPQKAESAFPEEVEQELHEETEHQQISEEPVAEESGETALTEEGRSEEIVKPENAKVIKYNTDDKNVHYITMQPDENGLISVYFDSDVENALAKINIYESTRPGQGWGYSLPTDGRAAYEFDGFDPEKSYTVEISAYCPGNYRIEGKAYVY